MTLGRLARWALPYRDAGDMIAGLGEVKEVGMEEGEASKAKVS